MHGKISTATSPSPNKPSFWQIPESPFGRRLGRLTTSHRRWDSWLGPGPFEGSDLGWSTRWVIANLISHLVSLVASKPQSQLGNISQTQFSKKLFHLDKGSKSHAEWTKTSQKSSISSIFYSEFIALKSHIANFCCWVLMDQRYIPSNSIWMLCGHLQPLLVKLLLTNHLDASSDWSITKVCFKSIEHGSIKPQDFFNKISGLSQMMSHWPAAHQKLPGQEHPRQHPLWHYKYLQYNDHGVYHPVPDKNPDGLPGPK